MANAVGLNMKFTADTGGIKTGTQEVGKLLNGLGSSVAKAGSSLKAMGESNLAAAAAQQQLATDVAFLGSALRTGQVTAEQFKAEMEALSKAATSQAAAFQEGASLTAKYATEEEKRAQTLERLRGLLEQGAISEETYARAVYDASGAAVAAAAQAEAAKQAEADAAKQAAAEEAAAADKVKAAEDERLAVFERGRAVIRANMTTEEQYAEKLEELEDLLKAGAIETKDFEKAQKRLEQQFKGVEDKGDDANSMLKKMAGNLKLLTVIEVGRLLADAFRSIGSAIMGTISNIRQMIDETAKLSRQTGIAVESMQVFQLAAQMSGVDNLVEPIRKLGIEIGNAAQSGNIEKFERLGLNFDELSRMAPEDQFKTIAASIAALPTPAERAAAAVAIFGEQGVKMLPLFESNLAAIEERMKRLGIVLTADQTESIEEMNDSLTMVMSTIEGIIGQVTANLAPVISAMAEDFLSFVEGYGGLGEGTGGTALADSITEALFDGAEYLAGIFDYVVANLSEWGMSFSGAIETMQATFTVFSTAIAVMEAAFYFVRSVFNEFLAKASEWAASFVGYFSSAAAEFLTNFSQELDRKAEQDRQAAAAAAERASGGGQREAPAGPGMASGWVAEGRRRFDERNDPAKQAEREAKRKEEQAAREAAADAAKKAQEEKKYAEEQKKIEEKRQKDLMNAHAKFAKTSQDMEQDRLDKLSENTRKALEVSDIRSGGISQVIAMATGREDPAVQEARKQVRKLDEIRSEIRNLGSTVEIAGAA